ncbi:MAG: PhzF family phenazine biosynthesis protein [Chloroflexi bacterium]|nr:PhzF family phenazine biosynthesis protein [Chloroflexota bacterium]
MPRRYPLVHVDVFTRVRFGGNQLAVFLEADGLSGAEMQAIAREMNFSESTFVVQPSDPSADARVRIFTPGRELPFAGHPIVGTGFVLARACRKRSLRLEVQIGTLGVEAAPGDGTIGRAEMEQPVPTFEPVDAPPAVLAGLLGLDADALAAETLPETGSAGNPFVYLRLRSLDAVRRARPDAERFATFFAGHPHPALYFFSTETESPEAAAHARMFSLALGASLREDPATGSAAGPAGSYLLRHGLAEPGRLILEQGYEMLRPSQLEVTLTVEDGEVRRVTVGGGVVLVSEGSLLV